MALVMLAAFQGLPRLRMNAQMVAYSHRLAAVEPSGVTRAYPHFSDTPMPRASFAWVAASGSASLRWGAIRLALANGDFAFAAHIAESLPVDFGSRGLPLYDVLLAKAIVAPDEASNLLARQPQVASGMPKSVRDAIVSAIYESGLSPDHQKAELETIQVLRPDDLYTAFARFQSGQSTQSSRAIPSGLTEFTRDAVLPAEPRLYPSIYATIPKLLASGIWNIRQTAVVVGRLLQDCVQPDAAARMLSALHAAQPGAPEWDALNRQLETCALGADDPSRSSPAMAATPDVSVVRDEFKIRDPAFGENLLVNGDFAALSIPGMTPQWWRWSCPQFPRGDEGLFFHDRPSDRTDSGIAILGLWRDESQPGVCGFYHATQYAEQLRPVSLEPASAYLLAFDYRTEYLSDGEAGVYIDAKPGVFYQAGLPLSKTDGCWHRFYVLGVNPNTSPEDVLLMLYSGGQNGGVGRVEFDNVSLRRVTSASMLPAMPADRTFRTLSKPMCDAAFE